MINISIGSPFCPPSTCPIRNLFRILQQFPSGPLLLVQSIFSKPPWGLWLRDLSNLVVTLGGLNLDLGSLRYSQHHLRPIQAPQAHLGTLGPFRHPWPTQATQAYLGTLGPFRHLGPIQAPYAHLGTLSPFRHLRPIQAPRPIQALQAHLVTLGPFISFFA